MINNDEFYDRTFPIQERLPRHFDMTFEEVASFPEAQVRISFNDRQIGDIVTDNSYANDAYRFHDVFHLSYAAILGWSPCIRNMLRRKRKSTPKIDEVEDGARAIITEEAISLLIFNYAKRHNLFVESNTIDPVLLDTIETLVDDFEVRSRSREDWKNAIRQGYEVFRQLIECRGGTVHVDLINRQVKFAQN